MRHGTKTIGGKISGVADVDLPREKLERLGPEALRDDELLAVMLRTGYEGSSVLNLAGRILRQHRLADLLAMDFETLTGLKGIGRAKAASVIAAFELARRGLDRGVGLAPTIHGPRDVVALISDIRDRKKEHFLALFLNARNQVITREDVSVGSLNASLVHPREVFAPAVGSAAASVVLAHNHPSGDVTPSRQDIELTRRLAQAGEIMGIEVVDHVMLAADQFTSFKEAGLL